MKITADQVRYVAALAQLSLTDAEVERMRRDLDEILEHMDALNELDTSGVEPMAQVQLEGGEASLRSDEPHTPLPQSVALANAPLSGAGHFKVPKVIER